MADKTINDLTAATTLVGGDLLEIENTGNNSRKITATNAAKALQSLGFRGARVTMTADDTTQNVTASDVAITFDAADFDTDSFFAGGSPTRLTIPANVAYVTLTGQVLVSSSTGDTFYSVSIQHRNAANTLLRFFGNRFVEGGNTARMLNVSTGAIAVAATDYFTLNVREESDTSVTIEGDDAGQTFLSLTVLG